MLKIDYLCDWRLHTKSISHGVRTADLVCGLQSHKIDYLFMLGMEGDHCIYSCTSTILQEDSNAFQLASSVEQELDEDQLFTTSMELPVHPWSKGNLVCLNPTMSLLPMSNLIYFWYQGFVFTSTSKMGQMDWYGQLHASELEKQDVRNKNQEWPNFLRECMCISRISLLLNGALHDLTLYY
jgi:hypothetical protein